MGEGGKSGREVEGKVKGGRRVRKKWENRDGEGEGEREQGLRREGGGKDTLFDYTSSADQCCSIRCIHIANKLNETN
jgi:hypothetical protein